MEDDELSSSVNWSYIRRIQDLAFKAECGGDVIDELWQLVDDACVQACSLNEEERGATIRQLIGSMKARWRATPEPLKKAKAVLDLAAFQAEAFLDGLDRQSPTANLRGWLVDFGSGTQPALWP